MRFTLHWRGEPLVALDFAAMSPEDLTKGPTLEATGSLQDMSRSAPMEPDTRVIGFGTRPEGAA